MSPDGLDQREAEPEQRRDGRGGGHTRRLLDKILIAFHHSCDQHDFEVAERLLGVLEMMLNRRLSSVPNRRRHDMETLVAAHERLWQLRNPDWQRR